MLKKLISHTAIYGLAPQIVKVAGVLVLPFITPYLNATDYGVYGVVIAIVGAISVFASLGLNIVLANSFTKSPNYYKWFWRQIYGFLIIWNCIYAITMGLIVYLFIPAEAAENRWIIVLLNVLPAFFFAPATNLGSLFFQLKQQPAQIAVRSATVGLLTVALNVIFIKYMKMGYMGWFWANAIAQFIYQTSYFYTLNYRHGIKPIYNFKRKTIKKQVLISLPSIPHYYSNYLLNSFDRVIMKFLKVDVAHIGAYNAAQMPGSLFASATFAANQAMSPLLLQSYKNQDKVSEIRLVFIVNVIFLVVTSVTCLFLKELLPLLIRSEGLLNIYPIAIIIIMAYNYRPMYVAANNKLFYVEKTKALLKVTSVASIVSVVTNLIVISVWGYEAAAFTMFGSFMYMGYSGFFIKEFKESEGADFKPLYWLLATLLLTAFVYIAVDWLFWLKILIALLIIVVGATGLFLIVKMKKV